MCLVSYLNFSIFGLHVCTKFIWLCKWHWVLSNLSVKSFNSSNDSAIYIYPLSQASKCMLNLCAASSSGTVVSGTASEWRNGKMWKYGLAASPDQMNLPHDGNDVSDWPLRLVHELNTPYTLRFEFIYPPKLSEACYIHIISNCTGETGFNGNRVLIHGRED